MSYDEPGFALFPSEIIYRLPFRFASLLSQAPASLRVAFGFTTALIGWAYVFLFCRTFFVISLAG